VTRLTVGRKVQVCGHDNQDFAEIASPADHRGVEVRYYISPIRTISQHVILSDLILDVHVPTNARCYVFRRNVNLAGWVAEGPRTSNDSRWRVTFADGHSEWVLPNEFHLVSEQVNVNPQELLAGLALDAAPLCFARIGLLAAAASQRRSCQGLTGWLASRIELLPH
jgi:hypothetical protein